MSFKLILPLFSLSANHSHPTAEWPSPRPIRRRTCRTRPSTATTTAAWRSRRRQVPSRRRGRGSGPWRCRRTTTSGPRLTAASARWSTRRTVRPGGVSPPSSPLFTSSIHPSTHTHTLHIHKKTLLAFTHTHTHMSKCGVSAGILTSYFFNQTPTIPRAVHTFVKEVCDLTAAQHNQYAT